MLPIRITKWVDILSQWMRLDTFSGWTPKPRPIENCILKHRVYPWMEIGQFIVNEMLQSNISRCPTPWSRDTGWWYSKPSDKWLRCCQALCDWPNAIWLQLFTGIGSSSYRLGVQGWLRFAHNALSSTTISRLTIGYWIVIKTNCCYANGMQVGVINTLMELWSRAGVYEHNRCWCWTIGAINRNVTLLSWKHNQYSSIRWDGGPARETTAFNFMGYVQLVSLL